MELVRPGCIRHELGIRYYYTKAEGISYVGGSSLRSSVTVTELHGIEVHCNSTL